MILFKKQVDLLQYIDNQPNTKKSIGFVPTMGALHQGHISLIAEAKKRCSITICSIFVNPTQFNNKSDFEKYPSTVENDIALLTANSCDVLYLPDAEDVYPTCASDSKHYDLAGLDIVLEGKFRPGHFQGVANVVHRLLLATKADHIFMGAKDFQQCKVVERLISVEQLPTQLHVCPTLREPSGLAMSSRNQRLSPEGKQKSAAIYKGLTMIGNAWQTSSFESQRQLYQELLTNNGLENEHLLLVNSIDLSTLEDFLPDADMVLVTAAICEGVRLIDNLEIKAQK
jgi:pantoate--beta-alanine ligase